VAHVPWVISDFPQFSHRGLLIDTSRHFLSQMTIMRVIDSLSYAKMNVLHWHIVDAQSFPIESKNYPKLWDGSWTKQERYTQQTVSDIVQYAKERGVRVMVEFDLPGHAWSWGVGYPDLLPDNFGEAMDCAASCPVNPCDVPIDPSSPGFLPTVDGFFSEMTGKAQGNGIFFEDLFHLGGDEVEKGCWNQSARIQSFMQQNGMTDFDDLYMYAVEKVHQIVLNYGRDPVNWEEVFNHFGNKLDNRSIIHIWLDHATLKKVVSSGYRAILSNQDVWYLDHRETDWTKFYLNDPYVNITSTDQQELILGGEVCMWGESIDSSNIFAVVWPRTAAAAERLWSYQVASEDSAVEAAFRRLRDFRCLLAERGIDAGPLNSPGPFQPDGHLFAKTSHLFEEI